jgi:hypothetical protein
LHGSWAEKGFGTEREDFLLISRETVWEWKTPNLVPPGGIPPKIPPKPQNVIQLVTVRF